jgi:hypothetical protein
LFFNGGYFAVSITLNTGLSSNPHSISCFSRFTQGGQSSNRSASLLIPQTEAHCAIAP